MKMQMFTIGQVAKKYGLSRSTLIYYDKIGVLKPGGRSESNYRLYTEDDIHRMDRIMLFRGAGLSLQSIAALLDKKDNDLNVSLEHRLYAINDEIQRLRDQQKVILNLLESQNHVRNTRVMTKETWVSILEASGLDENGMRNWHIEFEKTSPEAHQDFLESIGIDKEEIILIRQWSRLDNPGE